MPLFGRKRLPQPSSKESLRDAIAQWRWLVEAEDPVVSNNGRCLAAAIRSAQIAFTLPLGATLLAGAHLLAASLPCSTTTPSEPILRFAGFAAVAIGYSGGEAKQPEAIASWFRRVRGRIRGSVFVPRDVEYAFAGRYEGLETSALDPSYFARTTKLLDAAIDESRLWAAMKLVDEDSTYRDANAEMRRRQAVQILLNVKALPWRADDLASMRDSARWIERAIA